MAVYEVTCEIIVERTVWVEARHGVEAKALAKAKLAERERVKAEEIGVVDARRETYDNENWKNIPAYAQVHTVEDDNCLHDCIAEYEA